MASGTSVTLGAAASKLPEPRPLSNRRCDFAPFFDSLWPEMPGGSAPIDRPTVATIHLAAVRANFAEARRRAEGREVIAVVKADAYGHGAVPVARALQGAGCRQLAVLSVDEACALRDAGVDVPILVLGGVHGAADVAVAQRLTPVVHHPGEIERLSSAAKARSTPTPGGGPPSLASGSLRGRFAPLPVHVEIDTGMHRMGVASEEALELLAAVDAEPALTLAGVYTHFARADEPDLTPTLEQLAEFRRVLDAARERGIEPGLVHCAHSAGLLAGKRVFDALPEAGAVRPGLMLYGVHPAPHLEARLRPAMTLRTRVAHLRRLRAGAAVGYAALFRAERDTCVATLPVGYADGVPIAASNRGSVLIRGRRLPMIGRVSMDYVTVDAGDAPVEIGDDAIVFGGDDAGRLPVEEAAAAAGTIAYELLVRVGARVPRRFED